MDNETREYLLRLTKIVDVVFTQAGSDNIGCWLQDNIDKLISDLGGE